MLVSRTHRLFRLSASASRCRRSHSAMLLSANRNPCAITALSRSGLVCQTLAAPKTAMNTPFPAIPKQGSPIRFCPVYECPGPPSAPAGDCMHTVQDCTQCGPLLGQLSASVFSGKLAGPIWTFRSLCFFFSRHSMCKASQGHIDLHWGIYGYIGVVSGVSDKIAWSDSG